MEENCALRTSPQLFGDARAPPRGLCPVQHLDQPPRQSIGETGSTKRFIGSTVFVRTFVAAIRLSLPDSSRTGFAYASGAIRRCCDSVRRPGAYVPVTIPCRPSLSMQDL